jgi:hypothetical protein
MEFEASREGASNAGAGEGETGYLRTILTYNIPSEAEVDKAFLESNGIAACLLNANTSRNELGAPFYVRLQVMEEDVANACRLIGQVNPQRFGSRERVDEIDHQIKRALARFALIAVPLGIAAGVATNFLAAGFAASQPIYSRRLWVTPNVRVELSIFIGIAATLLAAVWNSRRRTG